MTRTELVAIRELLQRVPGCLTAEDRATCPVCQCKAEMLAAVERELRSTPVL